MKITIGGSENLTITRYPYEPDKVESVFYIEKEVDDNANVEETFENLQEKVNGLLKKDINNKIKQLAEQHNEMKRNLPKV